jgi:hypothetical protein
MSLDDDLAAWAATVRLGDAEAGDIFQRIIQTPVHVQAETPRLAPSWWRGYTADFAARMVTSTRPARRAA